MKQRTGAGTFIRILIILVLVVLIGGVLAFNFFFKTDGTPSNIFGLYFLRTNEIYMEPEIMPGDMVIAVKTDPSKLKADDVVICQFDERVTIIRIIAVEEADGINPAHYWVKYDTVDDSKAFQIDSSKILSLAKYKDPVMGQLLGAATSIPGIIIAVIIPLTIIIIYQITRFAKERSDDADDYEELPDKPGESQKERTERRFKERTEDLTEMLSKRDLDEPVKLSALKSESAEGGSRGADMGRSSEMGRGLESGDNARSANFLGSNRSGGASPERKLSIDERGRAELTDSATRQISITAYPKPSETDGPRFQSRIGFPEKETPPVMFVPPDPQQGAAKPVTRIDDLLRDRSTISSDDSAILRPKPASVIPDRLTQLQQGASSKPASFDESVREYYQTPAAKNEPASSDSFLEPTIPEGATAPKEKIAPVRRKKPGSTVDELMKMIDDQTSRRR